ncbi:hypothetical protein BDN71DRAFT_1496464 [Pleurotus eryngii]|uniref:Uncharacterized protein n=1 Tax=Pleurotus eryngii TaxID=5323 RepID=A0A9P5ZVE0_PLEER|nr:hypothetical protein BDN71DRAFT_1496464 [Pleurotus eryngii]
MDPIFNNYPRQPINKDDNADSAGTVAVINKRDILPGTVSFPGRDGQESMKLSKWLRQQKTSDGHPIMIIETTLGQFGWRYDTTRVAVSIHLTQAYE